MASERRSRSGTPPCSSELSRLASRYRFPGGVLRVLREVASDESSFDSLARVIETDMDLAPRIIRVGASAFYASRNDPRRRPSLPATSIRNALRKLGFRGATNVALTYGMTDLAEQGRERTDAILAHSLVVAELARALGGTRGRAFGEEAYLAGLVHDIGKLVLLRAIPGEYEEIIRIARTEGWTALEAETAHWDPESDEPFDHRTVGVAMLRMNGFADRILDAVASHHDFPLLRFSSWSRYRGIPEDLAVLTAVANRIAHHAGHGDGICGRNAYAEHLPELAAALGVDLARWDKLIRDSLKRARETLSDTRTGTAGPVENDIAALRERVRPVLPTNPEAPVPVDSRYETCTILVELLRERATAGLFDFVAHTGRAPAQLEALLDAMKALEYLEEVRPGEPTSAFRAGRKARTEAAAAIVDRILAVVDGEDASPDGSAP